jgi:putative PIN family toxin of toxin-antitoxin system
VTPPLVVLDTQVFISAMIGYEDAASHRVCKAVGSGDVRLAISDDFLRELSRVVGYPEVEAKIPSVARAVRIALDVGVMGTLHHPRRYDWPSIVDPNDGWMLDLAWHAEADYIATRDGHLGNVPTLPFPIEVLTAPQLLSRLPAD